jgi:hypothetical protein
MFDKWLARYIPVGAFKADRRDKYQTISAYTVNDATRIAEKRSPKGYLLLSVVKKI